MVARSACTSLTWPEPALAMRLWSRPLDPGVQRRLGYADLLSQLTDRPLIGLTCDLRLAAPDSCCVDCSAPTRSVGLQLSLIALILLPSNVSRDAIRQENVSLLDA